MQRSMFATIGFKIVRGEPKAIVHWVFVPPRKSWRPLPDKIESHEKEEIKANLTAQLIHSLSCTGLKAELQKRSIRAATTTQEALVEVLLRVLKRGTREGELRLRAKGRPAIGGTLTAPTGDARMVSQYLFACLIPHLKTGKLHNELGTECYTTMD